MMPLLVTARLRQGFVASDPWSPALDGILAAWALRDLLGEEEWALGMSGGRELLSPELPLERASDGEHWWWVCSAPIVADPILFDAWTHRRFDAGEAAGRVDPKVRSVLVKGGPYKIYRNRETVTLPRDGCVRWHCIGDAANIERLLRRCTAIGRGRTHGRGEVLTWTVKMAGADERLAREWRPLPVDWALARGLTGPVLRWGIRPPGRLPEHQTPCVMP